MSTQGLAASWQVLQFFFLKTAIGSVVCVIGFFLGLIASLKEGNFKRLALLVVLILTIIFVFVLPYRQEADVRSAVDVYGYHEPSIKQDPLRLPIVFSFIAQAVDSIVMAVIFLLDYGVDAQLRFLKSPFALQALSFDTYQFVHQPIENAQLTKSIENFVYAVYLPSLIKCRQKGECNDHSSRMWSGHPKIIAYYSTEQRARWQELERQLRHFINSPNGIWPDAKEALSVLKTSKDDWDDRLISSMMRASTLKTKDRWITLGFLINVSAAYVYGWANYAVYLAFPFMLLLMLIALSPKVLIVYLEIFVWVKSWVLGAAFSYYASLLAARVQAAGSSDIGWFWEAPYYLGLGSFLLLLVPFISFLAVHRLFSSMYKRY